MGLLHLPVPQWSRVQGLVAGQVSRGRRRDAVCGWVLLQREMEEGSETWSGSFDCFEWRGVHWSVGEESEEWTGCSGVYPSPADCQVQWRMGEEQEEGNGSGLVGEWRPLSG